MVTIDTNIAFYALARGERATLAKSLLESSAFLSTQVLNEFALAARRKLGRDWVDIAADIDILRRSVPGIAPVDDNANREALRIANRYQINFFDAVLTAVALAHDATTIFSEDMHHGLVIDGKLTITNPFREPA